MAHSPGSFPLLLACREVVGPFTPATHKRAVSPSAISRELVVDCVVVVGHHRHARRPLSHSVGLHTAGRRRQRGKQRHTSRRVASGLVASFSRSRAMTTNSGVFSLLCYSPNAAISRTTPYLSARVTRYMYTPGNPITAAVECERVSSNVYYSNDIRVCVRLHTNVVTRIDGMK